MAEWLVEEGIGEDRAALIENGEIIAARVDWHNHLKAGQIVDAELVERVAGSPRGKALSANLEEFSVDGLPRSASEGTTIRLKITRSAVWERLRHKQAQARPTEEDLRPRPTLAEELGARRVASIEGWNDLWIDAVERYIPFSGGSLTVEPTSALTAIDVDGSLAPKALSLAAVPAIAQTIRRLDLSGSLVIDFPTLATKADRIAVDAALAAALGDWRHERTAMNGFGLVQIVARRERASLVELVDRLPHVAAAHILLRRGEQLQGPGKVELVGHPYVMQNLSKDWLAQLARRTGREVVTRADPKLAITSPHAQLVPL